MGTSYNHFTGIRRSEPVRTVVLVVLAVVFLIVLLTRFLPAAGIL
jgi:hypothetical protein